MTEPVEAFVTYCSAEKDRSPGLLPALERYKSMRIRHVKEAADSQGVAFYILSGEFGLRKPSALTPFYDHSLRAPEIDQLVRKVAGQLVKEHLTRVTFFVSMTRSSQAKPYEETIKRACELTGVDFSEVTLEADNMSDWQRAMAEARSAKMLLLKDRAAGEKRFEQVLERHGEDGMIYFIRGGAYESLEENEPALNDYRLAEILFPLPKYKEQARNAAARIEARLLPSKKWPSSENELERVLKTVPDPLIVKAVRDAIRFVESDPADAVRAVGERGIRALIMYLERESRLEPADNWRQRTRQLSERKIISGITAYEMDAVREIRNKVASEGAAVTRLDAEASVKMFIAALANVFGSRA